MRMLTTSTQSRNYIDTINLNTLEHIFYKYKLNVVETVPRI